MNRLKRDERWTHGRAVLNNTVAAHGRSHQDKHSPDAHQHSFTTTDTTTANALWAENATLTSSLKTEGTTTANVLWAENATLTGSLKAEGFQHMYLQSSIGESFPSTSNTTTALSCCSCGNVGLLSSIYECPGACSKENCKSKRYSLSPILGKTGNCVEVTPPHWDLCKNVERNAKMTLTGRPPNELIFPEKQRSTAKLVFEDIFQPDMYVKGKDDMYLQNLAHPEYIENFKDLKKRMGGFEDLTFQKYSGPLYEEGRYITSNGVRYIFRGNSWRLLLFHGVSRRIKVIGTGKVRELDPKNTTLPDLKDKLKESFNNLGNYSKMRSHIQNGLFLSTYPLIAKRYAHPQGVKRKDIEKSGGAVLIEVSVSSGLMAAWDPSINNVQTLWEQEYGNFDNIRNRDQTIYRDEGLDIMRDSADMPAYYIVNPQVFDDQDKFQVENIYALHTGFYYDDAKIIRQAK